MKSKRKAAGENQESQVSYFLTRYFGNDPDYRIIENLKFEVDGFNSQIDHLIVCRTGFIVIESKSIHGEVRVNAQGEWERSYQDSWFGIASPVQQVAVQIDNLKSLLRANSEKMLGTMLGFQKGFGGRRYKHLIALSSSARLDRENIPKSISSNIVKTEFLTDKVKELTASAKSGIRSFAKSEPRFTDEEMDKIFEFLSEFKQDRKATSDEVLQKDRNGKETESTSPIAIGTVEIACKSCGSADHLGAKYGKFGYYASCGKCSANTALKTDCPSCGSSSTKTRKSKSQMLLDCQSCQKTTPFNVIWHS